MMLGNSLAPQPTIMAGPDLYLVFPKTYDDDNHHSCWGNDGWVDHHCMTKCRQFPRTAARRFWDNSKTKKKLFRKNGILQNNYFQSYKKPTPMILVHCMWWSCLWGRPPGGAASICLSTCRQLAPPIFHPLLPYRAWTFVPLTNNWTWFLWGIEDGLVEAK